MQFYKDKDLLEKFEDTISFGIVPVGETKQITVWLKNDDSPKKTGSLQNLKFIAKCYDPDTDNEISTEEIKILNAPKEMAILEVTSIILEWSPNIDLEQGLKAKLMITGQKVIG